MKLGLVACFAVKQTSLGASGKEAFTSSTLRLHFVSEDQLDVKLPAVVTSRLSSKLRSTSWNLSLQ